ncbi:MAG: glycosyltransferase, partial [Bacteroidaceae bacterium]|nr:glycosyltransferase [Bacteroidaceae bacterium]
DVFLLTSETEAFAMVLAEAGSFGVPSVIMSIPGVDNYVIRDGINGFICAQEAYQDMADKVCLLLCDDNLYESMSKEAVLLANRLELEYK